MKTIIILMTVLLTTALAAQPVEDVFAAACGGAKTSGGVTYQWLLGELMVDLYADGISLDQGFGPAPCFTVSTHHAGPVQEVALAAYPNPTTNTLHLEAISLKRYTAILYDFHGRQLSVQEAAAGRAEFQLSDRPAGTYMVAVWENGRLIKSFSIQKTQ